MAKTKTLTRRRRPDPAAMMAAELTLELRRLLAQGKDGEDVARISAMLDELF